MNIWNSKQIEEALKVSVMPGLTCGPLQFNSKKVNEGDLFIALNGKRDGHEFVAEALENGASAAIVSKEIKGVDDKKLIKVDDAFDALCALAEYKRRKSKAKFIAITGSVGKTTTKAVVRIMLSAYGKTYASHGTFNNYLGVPLTLASLPDDTEYAIIEMGMNAPGELAHLSNQVTPDIAVITTISDGHIEFFESIDKIADAKCEIFDGLDINTGIAIINRDIMPYGRCIQNIDRGGLHHIKTFGKHMSANVRFVSHEMLENQDVRLKYAVCAEDIEIAMSAIPSHLAENFAAGFAVVNALKLDVEHAATAICSFQPLLGRGRIVDTQSKGKSYQIICDYYNSNPQSLRASLDYLSQFDSENKAAILGTMAELGEKEAELHKNMAQHIIESGVTKLFLVGDAMVKIKGEFSNDIEVECYLNADEAIKKIDKHLTGDELILIKGSRSVALDKVAKHLGVKNVL